MNPIDMRMIPPHLPSSLVQAVETELPPGGRSVADAAFAATHIGGATSCLEQPTWGAEAGAPASPEEERMTGGAGQRSDGVPVHRPRAALHHSSPSAVQRTSPHMGAGLARLSSGAAKMHAAEGGFMSNVVEERRQGLAQEGMPATPPAPHLDRAAGGSGLGSS